MGKGPSTQSIPASLLDTEQDGGVGEQTEIPSTGVCEGGASQKGAPCVGGSLSWWVPASPISLDKALYFMFD